jgi:hypothetical protein
LLVEVTVGAELPGGVTGIVTTGLVDPEPPPPHAVNASTKYGTYKKRFKTDPHTIAIGAQLVRPIDYKLVASFIEALRPYIKPLEIVKA